MSELATERVGQFEIEDMLCGERLVAAEDKSGLYYATISSAWKVIYAYGGTTVSVVLRAIEQEVGVANARVVSATATFVKPVDCGPVEIEVRVLHRGKTMFQCVAELRHRGETRPRLEVLASVSLQELRAATLVDARFPAWVPPPLECPWRESSPTDPPLIAQTEWREVPAALAREQNGLRPTSVLAWERFRKPPRLDDGRIDPFAMLAVFSDNLSPAVQRYRSTETIFCVAVELNIQFFATTDKEWILEHGYLNHVSDPFAYGTVELWDETGTLLAMAHQRGMVVALPNETGGATATS